MSERDSYPAGVPCWVTNLQHDVPAACAFYEGLLGWQTVAGPDDVAPYAVGRLRGLDVAGIGAPPDERIDPAWITEIRVDDLAAGLDLVEAAGGTAVEPRIDFDDIGRLAVVTDPDGTTFCLWEAGAREGAQVVNEPGAWSMSRLQTSDVERATRFYAEVFGWRPQAFGPVTVMRLPGYVGGEPSQPVPRDVVAVVAPASDGTPARWAVDFWVSDVDAVVADAPRLGGSVAAGPYDVPQFRQAVLADPGGATFSVSQLVAG